MNEKRPFDEAVSASPGATVPMNLVQFVDEDAGRRVGLVEGTLIRPLNGLRSSYEVVLRALRDHMGLAEVVAARLSGATCDYEGLLEGGRLLPPFDHPDPAHCLVTGTGLNHAGSALARDAMHAAPSGSLSDSMKMYRLGAEGGKPPPGAFGVQPEWFYKGDGSCVVPPGGALELPPYALSGGEEAELVGLYVISDEGEVVRVGYTLGNEFSDHRLEAQNYLYLAHSKLRSCALGPELYVGELPSQVEGSVRVLRGGKTFWTDSFASGEANMTHSLENLEQHHFKYPMFRRPGDVHCHFFGAAVLSSAAGITLEEGDTVECAAPIMTRPLRNTLFRRSAPHQPQPIRSIWKEGASHGAL